MHPTSGDVPNRPIASNAAPTLSLSDDTSRELPAPATEAELDERLSYPTPGVLNALRRLEGDFLILGVSGKMGPTLAQMLKRGLNTLGKPQRVLGVARFSDPAVETQLQAAGVETLHCDLLDRESVRKLPYVPNVLYLAGQKFGTNVNPERTWAMNTLAPGWVAEKFRGSRTVVFSTGCVYAHTPVMQGGSRETDPLEPLGEYANSCVGRERVYGHLAQQHRTPILLFRLNYAIDLRYGVLLDIAQKVAAGTPVDVAMGHVNVIWQGDANAWAIQCLEHVACPPIALNVTGPETVSVRALTLRFGELLGQAPVFIGEEATTALLSNASRAHGMFGYPTVTLDQMTCWVAAWVRQGGRSLDRPTHFAARDGRF